MREQRKFKLYDPLSLVERQEYPNAHDFSLDVSGLTMPKRETTVHRDKWEDYHLLQKRDGETHAIILSKEELRLVLEAVKRLSKE